MRSSTIKNLQNAVDNGDAVPLSQVNYLLTNAPFNTRTIGEVSQLNPNNETITCNGYPIVNAAVDTNYDANSVVVLSQITNQWIPSSNTFSDLSTNYPA